MASIICIAFFLTILGSAKLSYCKHVTYVVHLKTPIAAVKLSEHRDRHEELLKSVSESAEILYSEHAVHHWFSARLSNEEAELLKEADEVLAIEKDEEYKPQTTRTPRFVGFESPTLEGLLTSANGRDVIIGLVDTGITLNHVSFNDAEMDEVPMRWNGTCQIEGTKGNHSCNKKVVGARYFLKGYEAKYGVTNESRSMWDVSGHGTSTSSIAAGASVPNASVLGYANGTARGMATAACLSIYKPCGNGSCLRSDVMAAMSAAVQDGVDILYIALSGGYFELYRNAMSIYGFAAVCKGITVICPAGNDGPGGSSVSNFAPWLITVGAGTIDRKFSARLELRNGVSVEGSTLYSGPDLESAELVYDGNRSTEGSTCARLEPGLVSGKIVVCDRTRGDLITPVQQGENVRLAGGVGMIHVDILDDGDYLIADRYNIPAVSISNTDGNKVKIYLEKESKATGAIRFLGTILNVHPAPILAGFSARGPITIQSEIIKPDMIAPGVRILAAWNEQLSLSGLNSDTRRSLFVSTSGTSISAAHVTGIVAVLKQLHPDWSPAALRSALMTTAYDSYPRGDKFLDAAKGQTATPFGFGAGEVKFDKAVNPGLVYNLSAENYIDYLCASNYSEAQIALITGLENACRGRKEVAANDLNYPSFHAEFANASSSATFNRMLTNVGPPGIYRAKATVSPPKAVNIRVHPDQLSFTHYNEVKPFGLTVQARLVPNESAIFGRLLWINGKQTVSSPIAISWV